MAEAKEGVERDKSTTITADPIIRSSVPYLTSVKTFFNLTKEILKDLPSSGLDKQDISNHKSLKKVN